MRPPPLDFAVVGAPKSGTTWFSALLERHPDICLGAHKDAAPLARDIHAPEHLASQARYHAWFRRCRDAAAVGEAAVSYLYSPMAREALAGLSPRPRIFVLVRDPVAMLASYHAQMRSVGAQPRADLRAAWGAGATGPDPLLDYRRVAAVGDHLGPWAETFGSALHVIVFDDLVRDPIAAVEGAVATLGLDPARLPPGADLAPHARNSRATPRSFTLARAIRRPPAPLRDLVRRLVPPATRAQWAGRLARWNRRPVAPTAPDAELGREIVAALRPSLRRLEALLGRPLPPHWYGGDSPSGA